MSRTAASFLLLLAAACSKPADQTAAGDSAAAPAAAAAPAPAADPRAMITVMYNMPKDTAAFEKYYAETHGPLVSANQQEIGFTRADYVRFARGADGKAPAHYRQAILWFDSMEALEKGTATPGFKKVADDIKNFSSAGQLVLSGAKTN
jgi:uncharacterized protein (TIGR02118 family)